MKSLKAFAIIALALVGFASCKTTEANYRAAYEATRATQAAADSDDGLDENTRRLLAKNARQKHVTHIVGSDTIQYVTIFGRLYENQSVERLPQFSVVSNAFSQIFNAQALC